ncbi:MAG: hypothetical protein NPIRA01_28080 [Nitrospirales bacterium]|nr:MAG: hypothetical protein NPIRA01_28080 [Nitrospirales bacterium]
MFETPEKLALGLITGIVFGFLLQKGRVAKFQVILGQLLLKDWTVFKIMLTAILVGAIGVYALVAMNLADLHVKPLLLGGVVFGGLLFGIGLAVFGYCPGTSVAACGEGRRDAMIGVGGMLFGAALYVAVYPLLVPIIQDLGDWGKITLPQATSTSPWIWIVGIFILLISLALVRQRHERKKMKECEAAPDSSHIKILH